jgi:hypothetical protein
VHGGYAGGEWGGSNALSEDEVVIRLVSLREEEMEEDMSEQVAAVDAVIRESENQQEEVSQNKAKREEALRSDPSLDVSAVLQAPEFQNSILLQHSQTMHLLHTSTLIPPNESWAAYRRAAVDLLLLEHKAMKWYPDASCQYLHQMTARIDDLYKAEGTFSFAQEFHTLQQAMVAIPESAGGLPPAFIAADPDGLGRDAADQCTVDKDGLQIVGVRSLFK